MRVTSGHVYLLLLSVLFKLFLELCFFFIMGKNSEDQHGIFTTGNSMWNDVTVHSTYLSGTCQFWGFETYPLFFFIAELKCLKKIYIYFRERNF